MQLRALRYFNEVAQCVSLRKAAERLYVTPTAVSRQIEHLEHYYGAALIERGPRGIKLTHEGVELARSVAITLKELDSVRENIATRNSVVSGVVRVFASESLVSTMLAPVLAEYQKSYPKVTFEVEIGSSPCLLEAIKEGHADLCLAFYMPDSADVEVVSRCELWHRVVVPLNHAFAKRDSLTIQDLRDQPLALPGPGFITRKTIEAAAKRDGVTLNVVYSTSSLEVQKSLARSGAALLILPQIGSRDHMIDEALVAVPIIDPLIDKVRVDLCLPRQRSSSVATKLCQVMIGQAMANYNLGDVSSHRY